MGEHFAPPFLQGSIEMKEWTKKEKHDLIMLGVYVLLIGAAFAVAWLASEVAV